MLFGLVLSVGIVGCSSSDEGSNDNDSKDTETTEESNDSENKEEKNSENNDKESEGDVAAVVNGEEIPMSRLNDSVEQQKQRYKQQGMELKDEQLTQIKDSTLTQLINLELVKQEAESSDINVSDEEVQKDLDSIIKQNGGEEQFNKVLEQEDISKEEVKDQLRTQMMIDKYISNNTEEVKVTDEEIQKQYDQIAKSSEGSEQEVPELKEVKDQIKQRIQQQKKQQQEKQLVDKLKEDAEIEKKV